MVVIDTLARSMVGGDENGPADMSRAVAGAGRIQVALNCATVLVHHTGKDVSKGARGHYSLTAAADTMLAIARDEMRLFVHVSKQKDSEDGYAIKFRAEKVALPDRDGEPCSSLVLIPDDRAGADDADSKAAADAQSVVCSMSPGETLTISALCKRLAASMKISVNATGYERIRVAIPPEGITRRTASGVRRVWRTDAGTNKERIHCAEVGGHTVGV